MTDGTPPLDWAEVLAECEHRLEIVERGLDAQDWDVLAELTWSPPPIREPADRPTLARLERLLERSSALSARVGAEIGKIEVTLDETSAMRRASRAYLTHDAATPTVGTSTTESA